jgi:hypothetical protein
MRIISYVAVLNPGRLADRPASAATMVCFGLGRRLGRRGAAQPQAKTPSRPKLGETYPHPH